MAVDLSNGFTCPVPVGTHTHVQLAHGGGGALTQQLIEQMFVPAFDNPALGARHDGARLDLRRRAARVHDGFLRRAAAVLSGRRHRHAGGQRHGQRPRDVRRAAAVSERRVHSRRRARRWRRSGAWSSSMRAAARAAGVALVTGDTKVVDRGKGDGLYVNTAGVGVIEHDADRRAVERPAGRRRPAVGRHRTARHGGHGRARGTGVRVGDRERLRAARRAGAGALRSRHRGPLPARSHARRTRQRARRDCARRRSCHLRIEETAVTVREDVRGACELLGFDPLYVANEGRFVAFVPAADADRALRVLQSFDVSADVEMIGVVSEAPAGFVTARSRIGATRLIDMLSGEQLPRIC